MTPAVAVGKGRYRTTFLRGIDAALKVRSSERPRSVGALEISCYPPEAARFDPSSR